MAAPATAAQCPPGQHQHCTVGKSTSYVTVGSVLRANKYGWPKGSELKFRWYRNGSPIAGGWNDTYTVGLGDEGAKFTVRVHSTKAGQTTFKISRTYVVRRISGTAGKSTSYTTVGSVLRANKYGWAKGTKLQYRWYQNGSRVAAAWDGSRADHGQHDTYKVRPEDKGAELTVRVYGTKTGKTTYKTSRTYIVR